MKDAAQIRAEIDKSLESMIARPEMWAYSMMSLEEQFLSLLYIAVLAIVDDEPKMHELYAKWRKFADEVIGANLGDHVAKQFVDKDDWSGLTNLMRLFKLKICGK